MEQGEDPYLGQELSERKKITCLEGSLVNQHLIQHERDVGGEGHVRVMQKLVVGVPRDRR